MKNCLNSGHYALKAKDGLWGVKKKHFVVGGGDEQSQINEEQAKTFVFLLLKCFCSKW